MVRLLGMHLHAAMCPARAAQCAPAESSCPVRVADVADRSLLQLMQQQLSRGTFDSTRFDPAFSCRDFLMLCKPLHVACAHTANRRGAAQS